MAENTDKFVINWESVVNTVPDLILVMDKDNVIIKSNRAVEEAVGRKNGDIVGKRCYEILHNFKEVCVGCPYEMTKKDALPRVEEAYFEELGKPFLITISPLFDEEGKVKGCVHIAKDISEIKKAEVRIRELTRAVEQSPSEVVITDLNGNITYVNPRFTELTGYSAEEVLGKNPRLLKSGRLSPEEYRGLWETISGGEIWRGELYNMKKNGESYWETASISPIKNGMGINTHYIKAGEDITAKKEAERKLRELMNARMEFTSMVSHELRTPLAAIKESIAIVAEEAAGGLNKEQHAFLDTAKRNVDRLARLINDVLDFQKLDAGKVKLKKEECDISVMIEEVFASMRSIAFEKGLSIKLKPGKDMDKVKCDRDRITQVITNLVNNAIKFTGKGNITIQSSRVEGGREVFVSVEDTGCGISAENMKRLFRKYEQITKGNDRGAVGTGLGLSISKEIVERHGGRIWAESVLGKGSKFIFTIPIG